MKRFQKIVAGLCFGIVATGFGVDRALAQEAPARPALIQTEGIVAQEEGATYQYKAGGVQFTVPEGWRDEKQANGSILVGPTDGDLVVIVWAPDEQDINRAAKTVDAVLGKFVSGVEVEQVEDIKESNGMRTLCVSGSGTASQKDCEFSAQFVQGTRLVVFLAVADAEALEQHEDALAELDESITRI